LFFAPLLSEAHVGRDWYFLAGLPIPVTKDRVADLGMIFWFMKAW
jgi:hypothetical protein